MGSLARFELNVEGQEITMTVTDPGKPICLKRGRSVIRGTNAIHAAFRSENGPQNR
jgi:hypothetical protein